MVQQQYGSVDGAAKASDDLWDLPVDFEPEPVDPDSPEITDPPPHCGTSTIKKEKDCSTTNFLLVTPERGQLRTRLQDLHPSAHAIPALLRVAGAALRRLAGAALRSLAGA
jgi:hypothetical protein